MAINTKQLKECVIIPTLYYLDLYSEAATNLLLGTCAQESQMGTYLKQIGGVAMGIYQIEPATHRDIVERYLYLPEKNALQEKVKRIISQINQYGNPDSELIFNLRYATAIARIKYLMASDPLPEADDVMGLANMWKQFYNTASGKGTVYQFMENYKKYVTEI